MNKTNKKRFMDMDYRLVVIREQGIGEEGIGRWLKGVKYKGLGVGKWVKVIKYMVDEENWTLGGKHTIEYTDGKL